MNPRAHGHQSGRIFFETSLAGPVNFAALDTTITAVNAYDADGNAHPELGRVLAAAGQAVLPNERRAFAEGFSEGWHEAQAEALASVPTKKTYSEVVRGYRRDAWRRANRGAV